MDLVSRAGVRQRRLISSIVMSAAFAPPLVAQTLDLPPRAPNALGGAAFARSIAYLPLKEREAKAQAEILAGNVPRFLRRLVPVTVKVGSIEARYYVTPDYLAIGSDADFFLIPLSPGTAQAIADRLDCRLPTTRMVDDIHAHAVVKRSPAPIPPSPAMTTVPVFLQHSRTVNTQRNAEAEPLGVLVAGHKKDVVIANRVFATPANVGIYGWHHPDGKPIQPLYTKHAATWVDYSHGIRLVQSKLTINGEATTLDAALADPRLAPVLSNEGVMTQTRYAVPAASDQQQSDILTLEFGVRVVIDRPEAIASKDILLVFYALPNGNTIEQTIGKAVKPGDDWHFDIQHIGAQTRFLRERITDRTLVVAYLENDRKSWPAWRKAHGDAGIPAILDAVRSRFRGHNVRVVLNGHSGGGSLIFGYINSVAAIPDDIDRIAFLDSNYAYETARHRDKLTAWLNEGGRHTLLVAAYNDAAARLDGKPFVSESGGTWGRSRVMCEDLQAAFPFTSRAVATNLTRATALDGRITFLLLENPERKVLHTVQVERNGFIESILAGTDQAGKGYTYMGERAYSQWIQSH